MEPESPKRRIVTVCDAVAVARELTPDPGNRETSVILFVHWSRQLLHAAVAHGEEKTVRHPLENYKKFIDAEGLRHIYFIHNHPHPGELAYPSAGDNKAADSEKQIISYFAKSPVWVYQVVWTPEGRHRLYDERTPHTEFNPEPCGCFDPEN